MAGSKTSNSFDSSSLDLENGPLSPPPAGRFELPRPSSPRGSLNFSLRSPSSSVSLPADERWEREHARTPRSPDGSSSMPLSKYSEDPNKYGKPSTGKPLPPVTPESPDSTTSHTTPRANNLKGRSIDVMDYMKQHPHPAAADSYFGQSAASLLPPTTTDTNSPATRQQQHNSFNEKRSTRVAPAPEMTFAHRVFEAGKPDLLYDLVQRRRFKERTCGVLDLSTLQRMSQHVLQQKLVEQTRALGEKGRWMEIGIRETLHAYCESIRDLELMEQHAARGMSNDPFLITTGSGLESRLLEDAGLVSAPRLKAVNANANANTPLSRSESDSDSTPRLALLKRQSPRKRGLRRTLMALVAALSLVVPMLIMVLAPGQLAKILTATIFAVVFAVAFGVGSELGPDKVAMVVGVYAAVLVLFVSNNPPAY